MDDAFRRLTADRRFNASIMSVFGILALLIGAAGVYGVMSASVAQRTREIGVRIALGALPREILRLVLSEGAWLAGLGIAAGLAGALLATRLLASLLFGVGPTDPATFVATAAALAIVAGVASLLPALRAVRTDPMDALRSE
jgi:ABC-type antimicrobial peptide transport system permease subunit